MRGRQFFNQVRYPLASHRRTITQRLQGTITGAGGAGGARHPTPGTPSEPRAWRKLIFSLAGLCLCTGQVKLRAGAPFIAATAFVQCGLQPLKCSVYSSLACCAQVLKSRIEERKEGFSRRRRLVGSCFLVPKQRISREGRLSRLAKGQDRMFERLLGGLVSLLASSVV